MASTTTTEELKPPPLPSAPSSMAQTSGDAAGLTEAEAERRLAQYGENALVEHHIGIFERLARFFWGPIPWMIEVAGRALGRASALGGPRHHPRYAFH